MIAIALAWFIPCELIAQDQLGNALASLKAPDWHSRSIGVHEIAEMPIWLNSPLTKQALLELLESENDAVTAMFNDPIPESESEARGNYYSELLGIVGSFVESTDEAGLGVLLRAQYNPDSDFALKLLSYGEPVVRPLLSLVDHPETNERDHVLRVNAYEMLGYLIKNHRTGKTLHRLSESSIRAIESRLRGGLGDMNVGIRLAAIRGEAAAGDVEALGILQELQRTDPDVRVTEAGRRRYLVREAAARAIATIRAHPTFR
ncbi:MAG TPA: hypothetical protein VFP91_15120 [Vicinamibacterales bacterium]|nr:hypothetical protein [Vicinamibacterales bacterium]